MTAMTTFTARDECAAAVRSLNAAERANGSARRWYVSTVEDVYMPRVAARGYAQVTGPERPECHAPSQFRVTDLSASNGARDRVLENMFRFWQDQGIARKGAEGWEVRDVLTGDGATWLPMSVAGATRRADVAERSHIIAANAGGALCPCSILPESGAVNAARGDSNVTDLPPAALAVLRAWPSWWRANVARKSQLARVK